MSLGIDIAVLVADTNDRPALVKPTGERIPHGYRLATVAVYEAVETVAADQSPRRTTASPSRKGPAS